MQHQMQAGGEICGEVNLEKIAKRFRLEITGRSPEDKKAIFDHYQSVGVMPEGEPA
jgi:hypothetical protein